MNPKPEEQAFKNYLSVIGMKLTLRQEQPDFYLLMVINFEGPDYPVTSEKKIILFSNLGMASTALNLAEPKVVEFGSAPSEIALVVDVPEAIRLLEVENADVDTTILNLLNILFDVINATRLQFPVKQKGLLFSLADHLTFEQNFSRFLAENNLAREDIVNALLWMLGAMFASAEIIK